MKKHVIINSIVVTMNPARDILSDGYVAMEDDRIVGVGAMADYDRHDWTGYTVIDGHRGILMPGMVNLHAHLGMVAFRGLGDDCKDRLRVFLLPMEQQAMDGDMVYHSTRYGAAELLLGGVTTVLDMYYFTEQAARAMEDSGIRGFAGQTLMDAPTCDFAGPAEAMAYGRDLMDRWNRPGRRVQVYLAPHATNTCSAEVLRQAHAIDKDAAMPFSLHTAEMDYEMTYFRETYGQTPVEYLDDLGVLDRRTILAHAIRVSAADLDRTAAAGASVAHCIASNTKAAKGVAPVMAMLERGIAVGFGTDGPASGNTLDLLTQMRFCANFQKNESHDRSAMPAAAIVEMATVGAARALGMEDVIGSLEPGKKADCVLLETDSFNMYPVYDPYSTLVYSAQAGNVRHVFVDGQWLVRDRQLTGTGAGELRANLRETVQVSAFSTMHPLT